MSMLPMRQKIVKLKKKSEGLVTDCLAFYVIIKNVANKSIYLSDGNNI